MSDTLKFSIPVGDQDLPADELHSLVDDAIAYRADERFGEGNWVASRLVVDDEPRSAGDPQRRAYHGSVLITAGGSTS